MALSKRIIPSLTLANQEFSKSHKHHGFLPLRYKAPPGLKMGLGAATLNVADIFVDIVNATLGMVFDNDPRSSPNWTPKVMRPGRGCPKKPAIAGPKIVIKNHT